MTDPSFPTIIVGQDETDTVCLIDLSRIDVVLGDFTMGPFVRDGDVWTAVVEAESTIWEKP